MSITTKFAAVAAVLAIVAAPQVASAKRATVHHSTHLSTLHVPLDARASAGRIIHYRTSRGAVGAESPYGAGGGSIPYEVNPDRVFPNQQGGLPESTPNGY